MNHRQPRMMPVAPQTTRQSTTRRLPRVYMTPINEEIRIYPIDTTICKKFNRFNYISKIIKYDKGKKWYTIEYQDGNWEEMSQDEITKHQYTIDIPALENVRRPTRSSL